METILIVLLVLILVFGAGGWHFGRRGDGSMGNILYVLAAVVLIVLILRLLGVWI